MYAFLSFVIISTVEATLPDIGKNEFIEAVKFGDSLYRNVDCEYIVDELFNKAIHEKDGRPLTRKLEIHWRREGIREYTDTTFNDGTLFSGKPFRFVLTFNGEGRKQWQPNENTGSIFDKREVNVSPVPIDFGMTLFERDKNLGESLGDCEITTLKQEEWQRHECYFVQAILPDGAKAEVWIDPTTGWRARRARYWGPDGLIWYEASVAEFKDCGNGAWFPVEGIFKLYGNDPNSGQRVVDIERKLKVEQVRLNADLTPEDFDIRFPAGTRVYDHIYGIGYVVGVTSLEGIEDEALDKITEAARVDQPSPNNIPADANNKGITEAGTEKTSPTKEGKPVGSVGGTGIPRPWILISIVLCAVLVIVIAFVSRRRKA